MWQKKLKNLYTWPLSIKQSTDSGMALVLLLLLIGLFTKSQIWYWLAIPVLVLNMTVPVLFSYWAWFWLGTTRLLGLIVSKLLLTVIYLLFVFPVGMIRKAAGKDPFRLRQFKKDTGSVMVIRNMEFRKSDIEKPF